MTSVTQGYLLLFCSFPADEREMCKKEPISGIVEKRERADHC